MKDCSLIFVSTFLEESASANVLLDHFRRLARRNSHSNTSLMSALSHGSWVLEQQAKESLDQAIQRGQLLYAWEGTRVFASSKGGAA